MAKGSQLSQLKSALSQAGITRQDQPSKKRKRTAAASQQSEREKKSARLKDINERLNPFDVQVSKLKHDVGGRKIRGVSGKPAQSKQTGLEHRKRTLLQEYQEKNRVGGVVDRRFGENDPTIAPEDRMLERFTKERQRASRGSAFNLEDEDELMHYGQSLSKYDDFDNADLALDEDDEEDVGQIDQRTVRSTHFGGFDDDESYDEESQQPKSKAEVMAEVIAKSKEHKALRQLSRQEDDQLRHQLDEEFDSIRDLLAEGAGDLIPLEAATLRSNATPAVRADFAPKDAQAKQSSSVSVAGRDQTFDQYVRELAFDQRAKPKDRTKTEEEQALEEKLRLEKAERRRKRRMEGAEDYDSEDEEQAARVKRARNRGGDDIEDDFMDDDELPGGLGAGLLETEQDSDGRLEEVEESAESGDDDDDDDGLELSDESGADTSEGDDEDPHVEDGALQDLVQTRRKAGGKSRVTKELPFTFECPESHESFLEMTEEVDDHEFPTVVHRIRTLHHPSLAQDNKHKLQVLAGVLLDHVLYVTSQPTPSFAVVSGLLPHLQALTRSYPAAVATNTIEKLKLMEKNLKRGLFQGALDRKAKTFPGVAELTFLRVIGDIWSTSDMNHYVVSPTRLLMAAYLALGRVRSAKDLASGLFLCTLWLQYENISARFVPEAMNFVVNAILHLAPHGFKKASEVPGNFPHPDLDSEQCKLLRLGKICVSDEALDQPANIIAILSGDNSENEIIRVQLLQVTLELLLKFGNLYKSLDGFPELFTPILDIFKSIQAKALPKPIQDQILSLTETLGHLVKLNLQSRRPLALQAHKPIPIASYVPKFETSKSSYFKSNDADHEKNEATKLRRQYKQEKKGALRELRKDARFLAGVQQEQQRAKDDAYANSMKRAFGSLEGERAEEKQMEREKARAKKRSGKR